MDYATAIKVFESGANLTKGGITPSYNKIVPMTYQEHQRMQRKSCGGCCSHAFSALLAASLVINIMCVGYYAPKFIDMNENQYDLNHQLKVL
jgi:hypothetical protein